MEYGIIHSCRNHPDHKHGTSIGGNDVYGMPVLFPACSSK